MRRFSSTSMRSAETGSPAGIPSSTATRPRPCDSPAVVKRNVTLTRGSSRDSALPLKRLGARLRADAESRVHSRTSRGDSRWFALPIIAREPDSGPGSRFYRARGSVRIGSPPGRCLRVVVRDGRQRDHHEPARRDPEQILLIARGVERYAQRANDRVANRDLLLLVEEVGVERADAGIRRGGEHHALGQDPGAAAASGHAAYPRFE